MPENTVTVNITGTVAGMPVNVNIALNVENIIAVENALLDNMLERLPGLMTKMIETYVKVLDEITPEQVLSVIDSMNKLQATVQSSTKAPQ